MPTSVGGRRCAAGRMAFALVVIALARATSAAEAPRSPFVEAHPVWRVSGDPSWRPYSFRGADGAAAGLDVEFARSLGQRVGARVEWVEVASWSDALRRFRAGEIDLLMGTAETPERAREMLFTRPYAASPVAVIAPLDSPFLVTLHDLVGKTVAVPEGHVTTDYLRRLPLDVRLLVLPDLDAAVRAVADGRADAMVAGLVPSASAIDALGLGGLKVAGLVDARFDLCVAVRRDWPEARVLVDAAIAADPPELRMERFDRWIEPVMGLQRQAGRWRRLSAWGLAAAAALGVGFVLVVAWNRSLRARVAEATAAVAREEAGRRQREKLLALGEMAAGVAHDFNNLLAVVLSEAEVLEAGGAQAPGVAASGRVLREAVSGGRALTGRLLRFVRAPGPGSPGRYDVREAIGVALALFGSAAGPDVVVTTGLGEAPMELEGYQADLQNAVLNLCLNARDAMPRGGTLTVGARIVTLSADDCAGLAPYAPRPGAHVEVRVADTGTGMPADVRAKCTEPFFTTKGESGTGLGLWMVHGVASSAGGALRIESTPGAGTVVALLLPAAGGEKK